MSDQDGRGWHWSPVPGSKPDVAPSILTVDGFQDHLKGLPLAPVF
jgi:hypothetical protein